MPAAFASTNEEKVTGIIVTPMSPAGKPAKMDGPLTWTVVVGSSTVQVDSADGLTATLISSDDPSFTQILVKGDANLGEGIVEISDLVDYTVNGAMAANLGFSGGTVEPK